MSPDEIAVVEFLSNRTHDWSDIWYLFNFFVAGVVTVSFTVGLNFARAVWMTVALWTFAVAHFVSIIAYYRPFDYVLGGGGVVGESTETLLATITPPPFWGVTLLYWFAVLLVQAFIYRRWRREWKK